MYRIIFFLLLIYFCNSCVFSQEGSKAVQNIQKSPLNQVQGVIDFKNGTKIDAPIPIHIISSIVDSINYEYIKDSTFEVININHIKISDKYSFFDILVSFQHSLRKEKTTEHLIGVYFNNKNVAIINNLSLDLCSELTYYPAIIKNNDIIFKIIDSYSCDEEEYEYYEYSYQLSNEGVFLVKKEIKKPK